MSFRSRTFVALGAALAGLGLIPTGIANHLLQLEPMGPQREAWMAAHTALGVLFVVLGAWHAVLNRRALSGYIRSFHREALAAVVVIAALLFVAVGHAYHQ